MNTKKLTTLSLCTTFALLLSYVESLIPLSLAIPGIKMGLANVAVLFVLYKIGIKEAFAVSLLRVLLANLLFGTAVTWLYSISGALASLLLMAFLKKAKLSPLGVSVPGAVMHNVAQIFVAVLLLGAGAIFAYLPTLILSGTVCGVLIGILSALLVKKVRLP
ncbi:MAG: Gx transporter family protein [Clostridia bacterium]|nr:Gx transporter family protein [Clostridia bacterium]